MEKLVAAPRPAHRLVPSRFPPIGLFDTVATAADAAAVMELSGWTNDRLVAERIDRLPRDQWVYGRANASVVMASFLHVAPGGMRFNGRTSAPGMRRRRSSLQPPRSAIICAANPWRDR